MSRQIFSPGSTLICIALIAAANVICTRGQETGRSVYTQISSFQLVKGSQVNAQTIKNDRVTITLTGTIYFSAPVNGKHTGAVFIGTGKFSAPIPESSFEKAHVKRILKADIVESGFSTAVFRSTDSVLESIAASSQPMAIPPDAQRVADEHDPRIRKDTGINIAGRLAVSILNDERPGVFFSSFRGGDIKEFSYLFDPHTRIPTSNFDLNAGEKGLIFADKDSLYSSEVLMAFYGLADYERRVVSYSDTTDMVDI